MNHHKIKVILFGMGIMGKQITRFLADKNVPVVAAVGRRSHIGEDIGELSGIGPSGVSLLAGPDIDLEEVIKASGANVAIHCSANLEEIADQICCCLENGLNVIILSEDAYFPFVENLKTYKRLNDAALRNRVTLVGLGMQDVTWSNKAVILSGNCIRIDSITCESWGMLDVVGQAELDKIHPGVSEEKFYELTKEEGKENRRGALTFAIYQIADELNLHVTKEITHPHTPILAHTEFDTVHGLHIMPGQTMGSIQCTELMTAENITLTGKICWAYGAEGATGIDKWTFRGIPSFEVITDDPAPFFGTAIDAVLRIPDVMKAEPGFITVKDLPKPRYLHGDLDDYV